MEVLLYTILTLCALGVFSAVILYFVARKFRVEEDPRIDEVEKMLPGANCGGCGFAGCRGMADALVKQDDISSLFCPVGGGDCMKAVAAYLGKSAPEKEPQVATVRCGGTCEKRPRTNDFNGAKSCAVASSLYVGETGCAFGCLGFGDCVAVCAFDAIHINPETGLPEVDADKCTACGACVKACPKMIIELRKKWPKNRAVLYCLLAVGMAGTVVWQRAATRSAYAEGGRAYTVFGDGVAAGLAADCGDTPVVTDYMIWGGHEVAENAFFLRYGDLDADAHALQVWRTEDHADDEAVYRVGFTLGQDRHYDIAWCGLGHGADPDVLTDVEVWLPAGTFLYDVLYYTTADGEEVRREVYLDKNGSMITLDGEILADSIRLAAH